MLPAHRVIGHKEYGNTNHPGRKSDPVYNPSWRRDRVANFRARTSTAQTPAPTPAAPLPMEDFDMLAQIDPGQTVRIPVPSGRKYRINVVSDSVFGQQVFGKQVSPGRAVGLFYGHPFGTGEKEWELFVGETHNIEIPCVAASFIEVTNKGVPATPANSRTIAVTLTPAV